MEREFDAYELSCCMCPSNYNRFWDRASYLWKKSSFYHTPLHSTTPLGGFPSEYRHSLWCGKTRMVSLPDGLKISNICLFVLTWSTNVSDGRRDGQTLRDSKDRAYASHRAVMTQLSWELTSAFRRRLKTFLFHRPYSSEWCVFYDSVMRPRSDCRGA